MSTPATECQRFFAFSKRVPKDVKRFCGICRQHGKLEETRGHNCEFKDCECPKCMLVRSRRLVMSQQIRLRRAQDKRFQRTTEPEEADVVPILSATTEAVMAQQQQQEPSDQQDPKQQQQQLLDAKNMCYFCQKCKNHGILVWKKQHKRQCPFTTCTCDFCELIETRRRLDQHIKRRKSEPKNSGTGAASAAGDDSGDKSDGEDYIPRKKSTASLPAQIEAMAMAGTSGADLSAAASFWRYSPPGTVSIPIGIAQSRIAEQQEDQQQQQENLENPLDALAAQIMRIQRHSPSATSGGIESRQSPVSSLMAGSGGSHNCSPAPTMAPSMLQLGAAAMDQHQQQQLQQQLLLSLSSPASSTGPSLSTLADFSPLLAASASPTAATAFNTQPMVSLEQMFATHPFATAQQQQSPAATNPLNDALLGQLLLMGTTIPTLSELKMPPPPTAADVGGTAGSDPQRELLLQIIAQLLQDQQIMEQQQQQQQQNAQQQQQQKNMLEALVANMHLNGATTAAAASSMPNGAAVEQLQLQFQQFAALQAMNSAADTNGATNGFDPTLMAALLMTQQQQQQGQMTFPGGKDMSAATAFLLQAANNTAESAVINNSMGNAASSRGQSQSPPLNAHQSAFTLLRPGFNMP